MADRIYSTYRKHRQYIKKSISNCGCLYGGRNRANDPLKSPEQQETTQNTFEGRPLCDGATITIPVPIRDALKGLEVRAAFIDAVMAMLTLPHAPEHFDVKCWQGFGFVTSSLHSDIATLSRRCGGSC